MFSFWQDLLFYFLPIPIAILLFMGIQAFEMTNSLLLSLIIVETVALGGFHQGATCFHFLDKSNRDYYWSGKTGFLKFLVAPVLIFLGCIASSVYAPALLFFVNLGWVLHHVVQQNIGVLLLYQTNKPDEARIPRNLLVSTQRWVGLTLVLLFFRRMLFSNTGMMDLVLLPIAVCALMGLISCVQYFRTLGNELASGKYLNAPAFLFWLLCVTYLAPFLFLDSYDKAVLIPLILHWCQYIGINYVVARRKYEDDQRKENLPLKRPMVLFALSGVALLAVAILLAVRPEAKADTLTGQLLRGAIFGLGMVHCYLDGFIWRFRDKFPREAMLPYLVQRPASKQA